MRHYKNGITKIISLMAAMAVLAGCGAEKTDGTGENVPVSSSGEEATAGESGETAEKELPEGPITLVVFSERCSYQGLQKGWSGKLMLDRFNVKLDLICNVNDAYGTLVEAGDLGDIVYLGYNGKDYREAVEQGLLLNWDEGGLVENHAPYISENFKTALDHNRALQEDGALYGIGSRLCQLPEEYEDFFYTWDIRWDLYEQLGSPEVEDLEDYLSLLEAMKEQCGEGDCYAYSFWPDWDDVLPMNVKTLAAGYYGLDRQGPGLYDVESGEYYDALLEDGPYLEMLGFCNVLYRKGLLDPDSRTQTYDSMSEKMAEGKLFCSLFDYAGGNIYNTQEHLAGNTIMRPLPPKESTPLVYGVNPYGDSGIWCIGAGTQYPELCMEILDYLATPDGCLEYTYGPKSEEAVPEAMDGCWYYEDGKCRFTDLGKACREDIQTVMPQELGGKSFAEGSPMVNSWMWYYDATNPLSGESYDCHDWESQQPPVSNAADGYWRRHAAEEVGYADASVIGVQSYFSGRKTAEGERAFKISTFSTYQEREIPEEWREKWNEAGEILLTLSWDAIYAETEEEYAQIVSDMRERCMDCGYEEWVEWSKEEVKERIGYNVE